MAKEILFSVTAKDCDFQPTRGTGKGGQAKNKTYSAIICSHRESGAQGYAEDSRSQLDNRRLAFSRMIQTEKFKTWHKLQISRVTGQELRIEETVNKMMNNKNIRVEVKDAEGKWITWRDVNSENLLDEGLKDET